MVSTPQIAKDGKRIDGRKADEIRPTCKKY